MGKRELVALLNLSSWCLMMVERLFLAVPRGGLRFVIVVFPDHTHLLLLLSVKGKSMRTKYWLPLVQALLCELKTDMIVAADLDVKQKKKHKTFC